MSYKSKILNYSVQWLWFNHCNPEFTCLAKSKKVPWSKKKNVSCTCQKKSEKRDASGISFMERQAYQAKVSLCSKMVMNLDDKLILKPSFKEVKGIY